MAPGAPVTRTALFVLCPGHSGSTLLGHFLGAHPAVTHLGEIVAPMRRGRPFVCRLCESDPCPVWGSLLREDFVRACLRQQARDRWLPEPLRRLSAALGRRDLRCALHRQVLEGLPATRVVVDSSKTLPWALWSRRGAGADLRVAFVHLRRDLRGVLGSHLQREGEHPVEEVAHRLVQHSERILRALAGVPPEDVATLHYEDLVADPAAAGAALADFLGIEFDPAMLEFYKTPQHVIGGNAGPTFQVRAWHGRQARELEFLDATPEENQRFYRESAPGFLLDLRWKERLTPEMLDVFERVAGPMNRRLGYPRGDEASGREKSRSA